MQPYLFPYIGYFQLLHTVNRFVVYDDVNFIKQGWINRNRILINGRPSFFVVPLKNASSFTPIRDTMIDEDAESGKWIEKLLKTFSNAYRRAPEFQPVFPLLESVFARRANRIADVALTSLKAVANYLDIGTEWVDSSIGLASHLRGEERVIAICRLHGATEYVNPPGGRELYSPERFAREGIRLSFLEPRLTEYKQFNNPFVPWLSIIDVLMFNPKDVVRAYLDQCDLR
jgi:WbqC-like protein family